MWQKWLTGPWFSLAGLATIIWGIPGMVDDAKAWGGWLDMSVVSTAAVVLGSGVLGAHLMAVFGYERGEPYRSMTRRLRDLVFPVSVVLGFDEVPTKVERTTRVTRRVRLGVLTQVRFPDGDVPKLHFVEVPLRFGVSFPNSFGWLEEVDGDIRSYTAPAVMPAESTLKIVVVVERASE